MQALRRAIEAGSFAPAAARLLAERTRYNSALSAASPEEDPQ